MNEDSVRSIQLAHQSKRLKCDLMTILIHKKTTWEVEIYHELA